MNFYEFVDAIKKYLKDDNIKFQERFGTLLESKNVLLTCSFDEDVTKGQPLPKLKKLVEDVLTEDKIMCSLDHVQRTYRDRMLRREGRVSWI